jgi:hypothetical protein
VGKKRRRKNLLEITAIANTQQLSPDESKGGAVPEKTNTKKKKKEKRKKRVRRLLFGRQMKEVKVWLKAYNSLDDPTRTATT